VTNKPGRQVAMFMIVLVVAACTSPTSPMAPSQSTLVLAFADTSTRIVTPFLVPADCNIQPDLTLPQYIIGYGSLMQDESRKRTAPQAGAAHPIEVSRYVRGRFVRGSPVGFSTTFLGVLPDPESRLNAVIYRVELEELAATDRRESSYCRKSVPLSDIKFLEQGSFNIPSGQVWIYANRPEAVAAPSAQFPIVQSYVDVFLSGCFEQELRFQLRGFAEQCLATTKNWSTQWVNDRPYPRRPFIFQPKAQQIDQLLSQQLPTYFSQIRIE
jgi:hypothetical protein